jgi:hypothetical protein
MLTARAEAGIERSSGEAQDLIAALLEAGAAEIAPSPRRLQHIFALADTHAISVRTFSKQSTNLSIADWAWSQLPWQTDRIRS